MPNLVSCSAGSLLAVTLAATPLLAQTEPPIAVQMYTLRDHGPLEEQLAAVAEAGVGAIETVGDHDVSADEMTALLDEYGLEVISSHVGLEALRGDLDPIVAFNEAVGNDNITVPYLSEEMRPTDAAGWEELGTELGEISADLQEQGMRLAYHNHDFEMVEFDGRTAMEILLEAAGPDVLAQVDLAWVERGGQDPAAYLETLGERVFSVHAKDNAPEGENAEQMGFDAVGSGTLDWDAILAAADEVGVEWYIIEHDQPLDAAATVATSAEFLTEALSARTE